MDLHNTYYYFATSRHTLVMWTLLSCTITSVCVRTEINVQGESLSTRLGCVHKGLTCETTECICMRYKACISCDDQSNLSKSGVLLGKVVTDTAEGLAL